MYLGGLLHELFFITLTLQGEIIIGPTKKLVTFYVGWRPSIPRLNKKFMRT